MRSISRVCDVSINTVSKLLVDAGEACAAFQSDTVRNVKAKRVQCDEIWSFCYSKQKNVETAKSAPQGAGDLWTWTAIDPESKLIISWMVGDRDADSANTFMCDLADRLSNRIQLTTDGLKSYLDAVAGAFENNIDYAMLVKIYGATTEGNNPGGKYSPNQCLGAKKVIIAGNPEQKHISTSYNERHNLTMRMQMKRFARLSNAFSKKVDNHIHALSLYFVWYNFTRIHKAHRLSPAMAAGIVDTLWSMKDIANLIDERAKKPAKRGPYKKKAA